MNLLGKTHYVISTPITLISENNELSLVLEVVSQTTNLSGLQKFGGSTLPEIVAYVGKEIYEAPLTNAFNRRYYDERLFAYKLHNTIPCHVGFLLGDLCTFKSINDNFGHLVGDTVLRKVARAIKLNIKECDSLIRFGGDEFLITMLDCNIADINEKIGLLEKEIHKICYDVENQKYVSVDFGFSYTDDFNISNEMINSLFKEADEQMYASKKQQKHNQ